MNLQEHKETIMLWIESCQTLPQINLLKEQIINNLISRGRFPENTDDDITQSKAILFHAVWKKRKSVTKQKV